jgi:hypothetical protein
MDKLFSLGLRLLEKLREGLLEKFGGSFGVRFWTSLTDRLRTPVENRVYNKITNNNT